MKHELAFTLIGKLLDWSDADFAKQFRELQLVVDLKYDGYQGFQPATRFHVALLNWLSQFATLAERQTAYAFVKDRLIYVNQREMHHLVTLFMPIIERTARAHVASELSMPLYQVAIDQVAIARVDLLRRRTLYVGLSDGARIDVFRRYNEGKVSNEQVVAFSEISQDKWKSLEEELAKSLERAERAHEKAQFEIVCLVDDFSGSGSSLIRKKGTEWKGKVPKFCSANVKDGQLRKELAPHCLLHIHHHLASDQARLQIERDLAVFAPSFPQFEFKTSFSYVLPPDVVIDDHYVDASLVALIKARYDALIEDEHTGPDIWYGYKQCGLPLVLEHNTPNNSVALLWATSDQGNTPQMHPLFARRKRHSSHG